MDKYKINFIFNKEKDINTILIKVLNKELRKHIEKFNKNDKRELMLSCMQYSLEGDKNC